MSDKPRGGQTTYTEEVAARVCELVASGLTLRAACREPGMPPESTVREWVLDDREGFAARYARARELLLEVWADETVEISDESKGDTITDDYGKERTNHEVVNRSRLRVDTRKWLLSKLKPGQYGDRSTVKIEGQGDVEAEPEAVAEEKHETWQQKHGNGKPPTMQ